MAFLLLSGLLTATAFASPVEERGLNCNAVNTIITLMRQQHVATPFCSSLLAIPTVTQTSTPACVTVTQSALNLPTITSVSQEVVYGTTTVYPVVAVSVTSTCDIGATYIPTASASSSSGAVAKRAPQPAPGSPQADSRPPPPAGPTPIARPTCLAKFVGTAITSACSCLEIPTPTKYAVATVTLPVKTITAVIDQNAQVTVTSTFTTTSFTSTYSATQYYTITFSVLPQPTSTLSLPDGETFGVYDGLDFIGQDLTNFYCYAGGPSSPSPYSECTSFVGCVNACAYYNDNNLGASANTKCGAVIYNAPPDGSSGSCYLKNRVLGCGVPNGNVTTGVLLPLIPNDPQ